MEIRHIRGKQDYWTRIWYTRWRWFSTILKKANWPSRKCHPMPLGFEASDLLSQNKADITVRTDKHKQNIYGPSMTTVESVTKCYIFGKTAAAALEISKPDEFPVLHHFATDCIIYWNSFMHEVMPLPLLVPAVRRAEVVELLQRSILHRHMDVCLTTPGKMLSSLSWTCCFDLESVDVSAWLGCGKGHHR